MYLIKILMTFSIVLMIYLIGWGIKARANGLGVFLSLLIPFMCLICSIVLMSKHQDIPVEFETQIKYPLEKSEHGYYQIIDNEVVIYPKDSGDASDLLLEKQPIVVESSLDGEACLFIQIRQDQEHNKWEPLAKETRYVFLLPESETHH